MRIPTTEKLTRRAIEYTDIQNERYTPENERYHNPLKHAKDGKHYNWYSSSSGFVKENTINFLRSFDDIAEGLAKVAIDSAEQFNSYTNGPEAGKDEIIGIIEELAVRAGKGAIAERIVQEYTKEQGSNVFKQQPKDENKGIDIRTNNQLIQVKLGDEPRSDWNTPNANENVPGDEQREKEVYWVNHDGDIHRNLNDEHRLIDRYECVND